MLDSLKALVDGLPLWALFLSLFPIVMILVGLSNFLPVKPPTNFLEPERWKPLPLVDRKVLNHNTRRFRWWPHVVWQFCATA